MRRVRAWWILIAAAFIGLPPAATVAAEAWPAHPIRLIVSFSPGGTTDTLARLVADKLGESLHQPLLIDNRPGAGGVLGAQIGVRAAPDGYTLLATGLGPLVIATGLSPTQPYDALRDFTHIALLGGPPAVLVVPNESPIRDLDGFISYARAQPARLEYGSPGVGSQSQLLFERFAARASIKVTHIPYKGAGQVTADLLGNHLGAACTTLTGLSEQIRAGVIRAIAVSSIQRLNDFPSVPTFAEEGYSELTSTLWFSLAGPARLPREIVDRLNAEVVRILRQPDVVERLRRDGIDPAPLNPVGLTDFVRTESARWTPIVRSMRLGAD